MSWTPYLPDGTHTPATTNCRNARSTTGAGIDVFMATVSAVHVEVELKYFASLA